MFGWTFAVVAAAGGAGLAHFVRRVGAARFLGSGAALSALLLVDDVARLHSDVLPRLGVPKAPAQGRIALPCVAWVATALPEIRRTRWGILVVAVISLATSIVVDVVPHASSDIFVEDAPKLLGTAAWATYFWVTTADVTRSAINELRDRAADGNGRLGRRSSTNGGAMATSPSSASTIWPTSAAHRATR